MSAFDMYVYMVEKLPEIFFSNLHYSAVNIGTGLLSDICCLSAFCDCVDSQAWSSELSCDDFSALGRNRDSGLFPASNCGSTCRD